MPRSTSYSGKIVAITGAAMGIGRSLALQSAALGAQLVLCDRNGAALDRMVRELQTQSPGIELPVEVVDVTKSDEVARWIDGIDKRFGLVDMVINNAGIGGKTAKVDDLGDEEMRSIMEVNYWGMAAVSLGMLPLLRRSEEPTLANVSSIAGLMGIMGALPYSASKGAIRAFTESLRLELMDEGIRVIQIHPGVVKTAVIDNVAGLSDEQRRISREAFYSQKGLIPDDAAAIILREIARGSDRILVGADAAMGDRVARWFPRRYPQMIHHRMRETVRKLSGEDR